MPNTRPPSGMRDFLPADARRRRAMFGAVQRTFEGFGYEPLETPAVERLEVLVGKYAEEGERLIYRVLKPGDGEARQAELGLRYNFTVPLARVVADHQGRIGGIFKAYQMGPVWRADRPGQGRQRESFHCDVDVVGASGPMAEVELLLVLTEALRALGLRDLTVAVNSTRLLSGLVEAYGLPPDPWPSLLGRVAASVRGRAGSAGGEAGGPGEELAPFGQLLEDLAGADGAARVRERLEASDVGREGLAALDAVLGLAGPLLEGTSLLFDPLLARGLDYYTGFLFEIRAPGAAGAVALGGRYDELIGLFAGRSVPACGGSLYMDRVALLLDQAESNASPPAQVLVTVWDEGSRLAAMRLAAELRVQGIPSEVFLGEAGIGKQLRYASQRGIPFALLFGPDEVVRGTVVVKDLSTGTQRSVPTAEVASVVRPAG